MKVKVRVGALLILLLMTLIHAQAGEITGGTVTYKKITSLDFEKAFDERDERSERRLNRMRDFFGGELPASHTGLKILSFSTEAALYQKSPDAEAVDPRLEMMMMGMQMRKSPKARLQKMYYDLTQNQLIKELDFMMRQFILNQAMETKPWKLTGETTKILEYLCMSAELELGKEHIKVWFTPQLPFPIGPEEFYGLPGMVLAVEENGSTTFVASEIKLEQPEADLLKKPDEGKEVTQEELDQIIKEKMAEFETMRRERGPGPGFGRRGKGPRH